MYTQEPLHHFAADYLGYLHESEPTGATFDGVHAHDDLLEDLSRPALDARIHHLAGLARRLQAIDPGTLTPAERVEKPVLAGSLAARLFELEEIRVWERDPRAYADLLGLSLAPQLLLPYAPPDERARRVLSKLRQVPSFIAAARANVADPAGPFIKAALETFRGVRTLIDRDLPRAFAEVDDHWLLSDLADASTDASAAIAAYVTWLEHDAAPKARSSFRIGPKAFARKLEIEERLTLDLDRVQAVALRELALAQDEFRRVAGRIGKGPAIDIWRGVRARHPGPGEVGPALRERIEALARFVARADLVTLPPPVDVAIRPAPAFRQWSLASVWAAGPFEGRPVPAVFLVADVDRQWSAERQDGHLRDLNEASLWSTAMSEAYPGRFLQMERLRQLPFGFRKSLATSSRAFLDGWAHYAAHAAVEAGFGANDPAVRLGQTSDALLHLARLIVCVRLHAEDLSVEQGVRFLADEAYLEEAAARREAERATFDLSGPASVLGKLMILKLRADHQAKVPGVTLRSHHDALLSQGTLPLWAHRQLLLGADGALVD